MLEASAITRPVLEHTVASATAAAARARRRPTKHHRRRGASEHHRRCEREHTAASATAAGQSIRPCTATDIVYRAFGRPYGGGPSQVINLFASCSYTTGAWHIFFQGDGDGTYTLMEKAPGIFPQLVTYYTASFTPGIGLATPVETVSIQDASGSHTVPVEHIGSH